MLLDTNETGDAIELLRWPFVLIATAIYNAIAIWLIWHFWGHTDAVKIVVCGMGYGIFLFLLVLRISRPIQRMALREGREPKELIARLRLPLVLWFAIPTFVVLLPL